MGSDELNKDIEPKDLPREPQSQFATPPRGNDAFTKINIEIEAKHLNEEGTQRLVLSELYRLRNEVEKHTENSTRMSSSLDEFKEKYYTANKEKSILEEKLKIYKSFEILYTIGVAMGSAIVTAARTLTDESMKTSFTVIGFALIGVSLVCKLYNFDLTKWWSSKKDKKS